MKRDEMSAVLFTSGSTGVPKGAIFNEDLMMPSEGVATVLDQPGPVAKDLAHRLNGALVCELPRQTISPGTDARNLSISSASAADRKRSTS